MPIAPANKSGVLKVWTGGAGTNDLHDKENWGLKPSAVIGIDASLRHTAICKITTEPQIQPELKTFTSEVAEGLEDRINRFCVLANHICYAVPQGSRVFLEGYSYASKGQAILSIAEFGGILRERLIRIPGVKVVEVPPTTLKLFVLGKGRGDKRAMALGAYKRWGVEYESDDEVDAYSLAKLGACVVGWDQTKTLAQEKAVISVKSGKPKKGKK